MGSNYLNNIILLADSYKTSHHSQYPPGTTSLYCYFESRGGKFPYTVFFGLQYVMKRYLEGPVVTKEKILEAKNILFSHFRSTIFNEEGWTYILEKHGGHLPIRICAVPEGSVIPTRNVLFTVENTDPQVPWLATFLETLFVQVWYPMTVATISRVQKQIIHKYLSETSDNFDNLPYMLHDFGFRGVSSVESAALGSAAHLINFKGSDTIAAISLIHKYYNYSSMPSYSVPAAEHSTITAWGREGELDAYRNILEKHKNGFISLVCDSYNIFRACEELLGSNLNYEITQMEESGGILCIRLDSGDPVTVILKILEILKLAFGYSLNTKKYKVLPPYLKILQGDGINYYAVDEILRKMKENGWAAENISFGSGGALLQKVDRDTQKCAFKCSQAVVNGKEVDVFKDPITDPGKKSKKGKLTLQLIESSYVTMEKGQGDPSKDILKPVFENGHLVKENTFEEIRKRAEVNMNDFDLTEILARKE